jgi:hypothetical protein
MTDRKERERLSRRLMADASVFAKENGCSLGTALIEITKLQPDPWRAYSEAVLGRCIKPGDSGRTILMAEVSAYAEEKGCSLTIAMTEVTRRRPDLWRAYSDQVMGLK